MDTEGSPQQPPQEETAKDVSPRVLYIQVLNKLAGMQDQVKHNPDLTPDQKSDQLDFLQAARTKLEETYNEFNETVRGSATLTPDFIAAIDRKLAKAQQYRKDLEAMPEYQKKMHMDPTQPDVNTQQWQLIADALKNPPKWPKKK